MKEGLKKVGKGIGDGFKGVFNFMSSDKVQNFADNIDKGISFDKKDNIVEQIIKEKMSHGKKRKV